MRDGRIAHHHFFLKNPARVLCPPFFTPPAMFFGGGLDSAGFELSPVDDFWTDWGGSAVALGFAAGLDFLAVSSSDPSVHDSSIHSSRVTMNVSTEG